MHPHTAYHDNWQTNMERMPRVPTARGPSGAWESLGHFFHRGKTWRGGLGLADLIQKCHGPVLSVYTLNTPDLVFLPRETSRGGKRACWIPPYRLTSVIHSFTIGFSVSCKVFFFLLLQLSSKILQNKVGLGLFIFYFCLWVQLF